MSEEIKPKKEKRFLKTLGKVGEILLQEVLLKLGSSLIKKIGGKKTLPSILFIFLSFTLFAQFPNTGNKQRLGFQTTGDGLTWRGSISDTVSIQPINNQNAWVILDTINLKFYSFDFTSNTWNALPQVTNIDTTSLSNRINLKLNLSDTASMLTNYLRTGVAASTYLTQANAASTYLPLTGGTLTGNLRLSSSVGTQLNIDANDNNLESRITFSTTGSARTKIYTTSSVSSMTFESIAQASAKRGFRFISSTEGTQYLGLVQDPQGNVGIKSDATGNDVHPNTLYVNGTLGVTGNITEGGNNVLTNLDTASLSNRIDARLNISDTSSMLTNYLRTGVAASTYQTILSNPVTGTGTNNYIPKFTSTGSTIGDANLFTNGNRFVQNENTDQSFGWDKMLNTSSPFFGNNVKAGSTNETIQRVASTTNFNPSAIIFGLQRTNTGTGANSLGGINFITTSGNPSGDINPIDSSRMFIEPRGNIGIGKMQPYSFVKLDVNGNLAVNGISYNFNNVNNRNGYLYFDHSGVQVWKIGLFNDNTSTLSLGNGGNFNRIFNIANNGNIGINDTTPSFTLDVNGTLGVTGATTLSAPLTVNSSAVFNEGSTDSDFRVESDGNVNMVFVDASTDRVGIGTNAPTKELDVNGELRIGTVSTTPSALLGKNGSNVVGEVTSVNQSGFMYVAKRLNNTTDAAGELIFAHGLSWTPTVVFSQVLYGTNLYINPKSVDGTNITLRVYDNDGNAVANTSINAFQWMAIK